MNNTELIKELKDCIALHMNPYNLGDMGRTTELIIEACNRLQKLKQCNVSGSLPLAQLQELKNTVNVLLLFAESDGEIVNGYRTKEIVQELKKLCGNDC